MNYLVSFAADVRTFVPIHPSCEYILPALMTSVFFMIFPLLYFRYFKYVGTILYVTLCFVSGHILWHQYRPVVVLRALCPCLVRSQHIEHYL